MATISDSTTSTQTVSPGAPLVVTAMGSVTPANPAVRWALGSPGNTVIDNSGTIAAIAGRGLDTQGSASSATSLLVLNREGATFSGTTDFARIAASLNGGRIVIDNAGTLAGGTGRGINVQEVVGLAAFDVTNRSGATFTSQGDVIRLTSQAATLPGFAGVVTIDNAGTIRSTGVGGANGQAIDLDDVKATAAGQITIVNRLGGVIEAAEADAIRTGAHASVQNAGRIESNGGNDAIDAQANVGVEVLNLLGGEIVGSRHGITGDHAITVTNAGSITGEAGSGINLDSPSTETAVIANTGTITGTASGADGDGVDVDGLVRLENRGTIQALGISGDGQSEALAIGGGEVENFGLLTSTQRAVTVDNSELGGAYAALLLHNHAGATITGGNGQAIAIFGTFADSIVNDGTIAGSVAMGGGDDTFILSGGGTVPLVDGGAGTDTLTISGASADFTFSFDANGYLVATDRNAVDGDHGAVTIANLERFAFDDRTLSVIDAPAAGGTATGTGGADLVLGHNGNDTLSAGTGDDLVVGGKGSDLLTGGAGSDIFFFRASDGAGLDRIADFGATDFLVTDVRITDSNDDDIITFGGDRLLNLFGGTDVQVTGANGRLVTRLEYDDVVFDAGTGRYLFVYSLVGSTEDFRPLL